jgi:hypothetical protein
MVSKPHRHPRRPSRQLPVLRVANRDSVTSFVALARASGLLATVGAWPSGGQHIFIDEALLTGRLTHAKQHEH